MKGGLNERREGSNSTCEFVPTHTEEYEELSTTYPPYVHARTNLFNLWGHTVAPIQKGTSSETSKMWRP